ncbi:MAG: PKD domain-containing protein [Lentisphaeria bacterium]|nr:PKD domain-containing protein [Lentisphaeria bacterium]
MSSGDDQVDLTSALAGVEYYILGDAGNDTINLGSITSLITDEQYDDSVMDHINGYVRIDANAGYNRDFIILPSGFNISQDESRVSIDNYPAGTHSKTTWSQFGFDIININDSGTEAGADTNHGRISNTQIDGFGIGLGADDRVNYYDFDIMNVELGLEDEILDVIGVFDSYADGDDPAQVDTPDNGAVLPASIDKRALFINGSAGDDIINLGIHSGSPVDNLENNSGIRVNDIRLGMNGLFGNIVVEAGLGFFDQLNIYDRTDDQQNSDIRYLANESYDQIRDAGDLATVEQHDMDGHVTGLDNQLRGTALYQDVSHNDFNEFNIYLGSEDDIIYIETFERTEENNNSNPDHEAIPGQDSTNIFTGAGDDRVVLFDEQYLNGSVDGEEDWDILDYSLWTHGTIADFDTGRAEGFNSGYNDGIFRFNEAWGGNKDDHFFGDDLDNIFIGNEGNDYLYGRGGSDTLEGGTGDDKLVGGTGTDRLIGAIGNDVLIGGAGADYLDDGLGSDTISGGAGDDYFLLTSNVVDGMDIMDRDVLTEGVQVDEDDVEEGVEIIDEGNDTIDFSNFEYSIEIDMRDTDRWIELHEWSLFNVELDRDEDVYKMFRMNGEFENIIGTDYDDEIYGNQLINIIAGGGGNDDLREIANPGATLPNGQPIKDTIIEGNWTPDPIVPDAGEAHVEYVLPVMPVVDTTDFRNLVMAAKPWQSAQTKSTTLEDRTYRYYASSSEADIMILVDPADDTQVIIAEFSDGDLERSIRVDDSYVGIEVFGSTRDNFPLEDGQRITVVDDLTTTGQTITVTLRGENNIFDSSTAPHAVKVIGSQNDDIILTGVGNDTVNGGAGNDYIDTGAGNDLVNAGDGDDVIFGRDGNDELRGDDGNDVILGQLGDDRLVGGLGDDLIIGDLGNDILVGDGTAIFNLDVDRNLLVKENGKLDYIIVALVNVGGDDTLIGGNHGQSPSESGDDFLDGTNGNDLLIGDDAILYDGDDDDDGYWDLYVIDTQARTADPETDGDDFLYGSAGDDWIFGQGGDDLLDGGRDNDLLDAGVGNDYLRDAYDNNILYGWYGDDDLISLNLTTRIFGGFGNDDIIADPNSDVIDEGPGDSDTLTEYDVINEPMLITVEVLEDTDTNPERYIINWGDDTYTVFDFTDSLDPFTANYTRVDTTGDFDTDFLIIPGSYSSGVDFGLVNHLYPDTETYIFSLIYKYSDDAEVEVPITLVNANLDLVIEELIFPVSHFMWEDIIFSASAFDVGINDTITYVWDFGDGQIGAGPLVQHEYKKTGNYNASLTVIDPDGGSQYFEFIVEVKDNPDNPYYPPRPDNPDPIYYVNAYQMPFVSAFESSYDTLDQDKRFGNRYFYESKEDADLKPSTDDFFWPTEEEIDKLLKLEFLNEDEAEEENKSKLDDVNFLDDTIPEEDESDDKKKSTEKDDSSDSKSKKSPGIFSRMLSGMFGWMF